jgi:hypothetical protein
MIFIFSKNLVGKSRFHFYWCTGKVETELVNVIQRLFSLFVEPMQKRTDTSIVMGRVGPFII